jgi:hypothetical protein
VRRSALALVLASLLAALLAGCALPGDERTFTAGDVTVVEGWGLVPGATAGAPDPGSDERPLVVSPGDLTRIAIHWTGSSCVDRWRVTIPEGNALEIGIAPEDAPDPACAPSEVPIAVTLDLDRVVQADAIAVEQRAAP